MVRYGNWATDTRDGRIGEVVRQKYTHIVLRAPDGGSEWDCPFDDHRIATVRELKDAGLWERR
ncbi:hypothetical protein ACH4PU_12780 [Streptomyces sp. NPDC021100]|uniref:hypothetical protein n=1 Tax=Streptomyces sp. NPDC021100 TaxID=3365114 RepID=UPI0037A52872